ncbi:MAG: DUF4105 domain-containing protein [Methylococcales bacterium]|nr:DUF4105 domain-containing protein [Methylococcales bacterium]
MTNYFLIITLIVSYPSISSAANPYLITQKQHANTLKLSEQRTWQRLLHYQTKWIGQQTYSLVKDDAFFFHPQGMTSPKAELSATLAAFFLTTDSDKNSAQCRFPARFQWLKQQLNLDPNQLPKRNCTELTHWLNKLAVKSITVVFPVAYLNNPASMFGHSFLKLDKQQTAKGSELLASTVNYAAVTEKERGLSFVLKGLFGGYQGQFTLAPYYLLLKEYADLDNRDLWEYKLNLNSDEIKRLLQHLWELLPTHFDYYFINKNCSYQLLSLLEVARPQLELSTHFKFDAIPADTIRAIIKPYGLLKDVHYRPALATVVTAKANLLTREQKQIVKALALGELKLNDASLKSSSRLQQAQVLELASDYLAYLNAHKIKYQQKINGTRAYDLLAARSLLKVKSSTLTLLTPPTRPDEGHAGHRLQVSYGYDGQQSFIETGYRWAYHDLYDDPLGFVKGAEVEFFNSQFRYYPTTDQIKLEAVELLKLTSLPQFNSFIQPFSWQLSFAIKQMRFANNQRYLTAVSKFGGGISYYPTPNSLLSLNLLTSVLFNTEFHQSTAIDMGVRLHGHYDPIPAWRIAFNATIFHSIQGITQTRHHYQLKQRLSVSKNTALILNFNHLREFSKAELTAQLALQFYF